MDELENSSLYSLVRRITQVPEGEIRWTGEAEGEELKSAFVPCLCINVLKVQIFVLYAPLDVYPLQECLLVQ